MGGGGGASHGCTVSGMLILDIHPPQPSSSFPGSGCFLRSLFGSRPGSEGAVQAEKSNVFDGRPTFLRATFVARPENIVCVVLCWSFALLRE